MAMTKPTQPQTMPREVRHFYRGEPDAEKLYARMTRMEKALVAALARPKSFKR